MALRHEAVLTNPGSKLARPGSSSSSLIFFSSSARTAPSSSGTSYVRPVRLSVTVSDWRGSRSGPPPDSLGVWLTIRPRYLGRWQHLTVSLPDHAGIAVLKSRAGQRMDRSEGQRHAALVDLLERARLCQPDELSVEISAAVRKLGLEITV